MAGGFPHRMRFKNFNARYRSLAPLRSLARSDELALADCKTILGSLKASLDKLTASAATSSVSRDWALGKKHIFLSEGARQHLELLRTEHRTRAAARIQAVWRGHHARKKWPTLKTSLRNGGIGGGANISHRLMASTTAAISSTAATVKSSRPRPQPISGTPPPDALQNGLFLGAVAAKVRSSAGGGGIEEPVKIRQGLPLPGEDQLIRGGGDQLTSGGRNDQFVNGGDRCDLKTIQKTCSLFGLDLVNSI